LTPDFSLPLPALGAKNRRESFLFFQFFFQQSESNMRREYLQIMWQTKKESLKISGF
jgi:hypothetical protein